LANHQPEDFREQQQRARDLVLRHRDYYGDYHHRKEQAAYVVTVLYLGAAATVFFSPDYLPGTRPQ
jgi:hypothetical protein